MPTLLCGIRFRFRGRVKVMFRFMVSRVRVGVSVRVRLKIPLTRLTLGVLYAFVREWLASSHLPCQALTVVRKVRLF